MTKLFVFIQSLTTALRSEERGATAVEYGLIVALIAAVIIAVVGFLGTDVLNGFNVVEDGLGGSQG